LLIRVRRLYIPILMGFQSGRTVSVGIPMNFLRQGENASSDLVNGRLELLFQFVEMVDFVLLGGEVGLRLLDRLLERFLVLAQLGDVLVLLGQLAVERLYLVVLRLLLLLRLKSANQHPTAAESLPPCSKECNRSQGQGYNWQIF